MDKVQITDLSNYFLLIIPITNYFSALIVSEIKLQYNHQYFCISINI
jgi:hypothetical protein